MFSKTSPYAKTPINGKFIGLYRHRPITKHTDDQLIKILPKYNNRPDLLSYDLYGTPEYWWIFGVRNPNLIRDVIWDMVTGIEIYVPSADHLQKVIG